MHRRCHDDPRDAMLRHFVLVTAAKGRDQAALDAARRTCLLKFFYNTFVFVRFIGLIADIPDKFDTAAAFFCFFRKNLLIRDNIAGTAAFDVSDIDGCIISDPAYRHLCDCRRCDPDRMHAVLRCKSGM